MQEEGRVKFDELLNIIDRKDFEEYISTNIDNTINFLKQHIQLRYEYGDTPQRKEIPEIPYAALREAIINAAVHRDYFEKGAKIMVEIFDDRVAITNPGGLVKGLTEKNFGKISILRNPNIASLLHRANYIEKMGTGINKIKNLMLNAGLEEPKYKFDAFFTVTFKRPFAKGGGINGTIKINYPKEC